MATVLGLDYGKSKIGVAFGSVGAITPLKKISSKNWGQALKEIKQVISECKIEKIILGISKGNEWETKKFATFLEKNGLGNMTFVDENFTTKEALEHSLKLDISQKGRRGLDSLSACIILERYFGENN